MSRAFIKEDAAGEPPIVAPRAPLPPGVPNYVTARGLAALHEERRALDAERARIEAEETEAERRPLVVALAARVVALETRITQAVRVDPSRQPQDEVRFGATVGVEIEGEARRYTIVGVDEADASRGLVAFVAPLAKALLGKRVGDAAAVRTPRGEEELVVTSIRYDDA